MRETVVWPENQIQPEIPMLIRNLKPAGRTLVFGPFPPSWIEALRQAGGEVSAWDVGRTGLPADGSETEAQDLVFEKLPPVLPTADLILLNLEPQQFPALAETPAFFKILDQAKEVWVYCPSGLTEQVVTWSRELFIYGYERDLYLPVSGKSPQVLRFTPLRKKPVDLIAEYERRLLEQEAEVQARRELGITQAEEAARLRYQEIRLEHELIRNSNLQGEIESIRESNSWKLIARMRQWRERLLPASSRREDFIFSLWRGLRLLARQGVGAFFNRFWEKLSWRLRIFALRLRYRSSLKSGGEVLHIEPVQPPAEIPTSQATLEIVICVHNALADVQRCLASIYQFTARPYGLVLVDDGSESETRAYLEEFAREHPLTLIRNDAARGYTFAANQGLQATQADIVILLNSDTVVTPGWAERMLACALSSVRIGMVGPLSNTASWQSIPEISSNGDWAENQLPPGVSIEQMGRWVADYSPRLYPRLPFLNGFCLLFRREVLQQVGYFDEEHFGQGYGEENDYCIRARKAGWELALADDVYIYHAQSRSYSHERRKQLSEKANTILSDLHGQKILDDGVRYCLGDRVLAGIRTRSRHLLPRQELVAIGQKKFSGRRVLFILPIQVAGGGSNIVLSEARAMRRMGVEVQIFNLRGHRQSFEKSYADPEMPVIYGEIDDLAGLARRFDALIATFNPSVAWMSPAVENNPHLITGYYIQDFEPFFYPADSPGYRAAMASYTQIPGMRLFTKTGWTRQTLEEQVGVSCQVVGPSLDTDLFLPRPRSTGDEWPDRPLRIGAMIRPSSFYRAPRETMQILGEVKGRFGGQVEIWLFGTTLDDPGFADLPRSFPWRLAGLLSPQQVARFHNQLDIFVDFSTYQAMGLTAMEAMACGVATIVPARGGAASFARHRENALIVDTSRKEEMLQAVASLLEDHSLRQELGWQALQDMPQYYPEKPAYLFLEGLFG
jgi:GT2 family glycosyltransferase